MADAAVDSLLENLRQLLLYRADLISDAKSQVEKLEKELCLFKAFLKDSTKKRRKDNSLRELVAQIRDVVYEAEDVIDAFVIQAEDVSKSRNYFLRALTKPVTLLSIAKDVEAVGSQVRDIYGDKSRVDFASLTVGDGEGPKEIERKIETENELIIAEAAVEFLLENLQQLLIYHADLIGDARNQVERLERDLRILKAFLKDSTKQRRKGNSLREIVAQIRDVVYEAEYAIDAFVTQATVSKSINYFLRAIKKPPTLLSIAKDVEAVESRVRDISRIDFATLTAEEIEAPLL